MPIVPLLFLRCFPCPKRAAALGQEETLCKQGQELSCLQLAATQALGVLPTPPRPPVGTPAVPAPEMRCRQLPESDLDFSFPLSLC